MRVQVREMLEQQERKLLQHQEYQLALHRQDSYQQEVRLRELLLEALRPVAQAMQRQDQQRDLIASNQQELLLEVLNSLQPSAETQIFQRIGQPPPTSTSPSLAS
jgi:hypothetical protein